MRTLVLLLASVLAPAEAIDVGAFLRETVNTRAPTLGTRPLQSGGWGYRFFFAEEAPPPVPVRAGELLDAIREATGEDGDPDLLGGRYVLVPARRAPEARRALARLAERLRPVRVAIEVRFPDGATETGVVSAPPGAWTSLPPTRSRRFVTDSDVEIACSNSAEGPWSCVPDPIVRGAAEGIAADVRAVPAPDGTIALEAVVQAGRFDEELPVVALRGRMLGQIELPRFRGAVVSLGGRVPEGRALAARAAGPDGAIEIRLVPTLPAGAAPAPEAGDGGRGTDLAGEAPDGELPDAARLWDRLASEPLPLRAAGPAPDPRRAALLVDLRLLAGNEEVSRAAVPALDGRTAVVRRGVESLVVADWDVEVGCYNQIGDPEVRSVFDGEQLRVRPRLSPGGRRVLLGIVWHRQETAVGSPAPTSGVVTGVRHSVRAVRTEVEVELPLEIGESRRLDAGADAAGRPLVLEVSVRR